MDEEIKYMVNESKDVLRMYNPVKDAWVQIVESKMLQGAQYVATAGGRVCIVGGYGLEFVVVDMAILPPRFWVVDTLPGFQVVAFQPLVLDSMPEESAFFFPNSFRFIFSGFFWLIFLI